MPFGIPANRKPSVAQPNSVLKSKRNHDSGLYYHDNYAVENFIQLHLDNTESDAFPVLNDPTYTGFKIFFHFDATSGLLASERYPNSALAYLNRTGQTARYNLLLRFINVLSRVNSEAPWIFQSIDGLEDLYNTPFSEVYVNKQLVINTLETIDGKISSLALMYRQIAYDYIRHVEVLPKNLRRFSMSVYLYDFRNFNNTNTTEANLLQTIKNQDIRDLNHTLLDVGYCEFDVTSGSALISSANNSSAEHSTNNLKIAYERFAVSGLFKSITGDTRLAAESFMFTEAALSGQVDELRPRRGIRGVLDDVAPDVGALLNTDTWKTRAVNILQDGERRFIGQVRARLTQAFLGNIHGFNASDLTRLATDPNYRLPFSDIYDRVQGSRSLALGDNAIDPGQTENLHE